MIMKRSLICLKFLSWIVFLKRKIPSQKQYTMFFHIRVNNSSEGGFWDRHSFWEFVDASRRPVHSFGSLFFYFCFFLLTSLPFFQVKEETSGDGSKYKFNRFSISFSTSSGVLLCGLCIYFGYFRWFLSRKYSSTDFLQNILGDRDSTPEKSGDFSSSKLSQVHIQEVWLKRRCSAPSPRFYPCPLPEFWECQIFPSIIYLV